MRARQTLPCTVISRPAWPATHTCSLSSSAVSWPPLDLRDIAMRGQNAKKNRKTRELKKKIGRGNSDRLMVWRMSGRLLLFALALHGALHGASAFVAVSRALPCAVPRQRQLAIIAADAYGYDDSGTPSRRALLQDSASLFALSALFPQRSGAADALGSILVTGARSGIGKSVAEELAVRGYEVVLGCRDPARARSSADSVLRAHGGASVVCPEAPLDLADLAQVRDFAAEVRRADKPLDGIVLCAGIDGAPFARTPQENEMHMQVNHLGHMLLTAELMPKLRVGTRPAVVSLTSSAAIDAQTQLLDDLTWTNAKYDKRQAYCVSKACCVLFSDHLGALGADDTVVWRRGGLAGQKMHLLPGVLCRYALILVFADSSC